MKKTTIISQKNKIQINYGKPECGWLPMQFEWNDFILKLDISDVPLNPINQMLVCLIQIHKGIKKPSKILWHLEPYCYYFTVEIIKNQYEVIIQSSDQFESKKRTEKEFYGNYNQIIMPLYRELKKFASYSYKNPHWEEIDLNSLNELSKFVKLKKEKLKSNNK